MIADDDQSLILIFVMPFLERGHDVLAVDTAERPHLEQDHLAAQVRQAQRCIHVQPGLVGQLGCGTEIRKDRSV